MFYRNNHTAGYQTPAVTSRSNQVNIRNRLNNNNINQNDAFSTIKPTAGRRYRQFGTNLTNKRATSRIGDSKTVQIGKAPKQTSFASKANNIKFNFNIKQKVEVEPEYCPKSTGWEPSIGKSLQRIFMRAYNAIGSYKLFVPSSTRGAKIDYSIQEKFDFVPEPNQAAINYLYDTDSDDSDDFDCRDIQIVDQEVEEVMLDIPAFVSY